jgi:hypothetical protein
VYEEGGKTTPVTTMRVKSFVSSPVHNAEVAAGRVTVSGWAWSGDGQVTSVEVRAGDGEWQPATVEAATSPYAWVRWTIALDIEERGAIEISSRATDSTGSTQPAHIQWNRLGYGNNAIRSITVDVVSDG